MNRGLSHENQTFIQALLAVAVFGIKTEFSDKGAHLQDKGSCSWGSNERGWWLGGCCELSWQGPGQSLVNCAISCI